MEKELRDAISNENLSKIYANGFSLALGLGDITLLLKNGPTSVGVVNLSYTIAKTLSLKLQDAIGKLEDKSGNSIMTTDDIKLFLAVSDEGKK